MFTPDEIAEKILKEKSPDLKIGKTTIKKIIGQVTCGNPKILQGLDAINQV